MIKKAAIVDYGAGNLKSICKAIEVLGVQPEIVYSYKKNFDMLILPGVGSFGTAIANILKTGLYDKIIETANLGKPILGICLGIQLLFFSSEEDDNYEGLKLIDGNVVKFRTKKFPVPHMCWNKVRFVKENFSLLKGLRKEEFFYFVHSYYPVVKDKSVVFSTTEYSVKFCSMVVKNNIVATQFHLEKSGVVGLKLLSNIIDYFNKL
ncbi:MAG: imidazole glycerol phosphate synthase subunit HisH [Endomicrobia bacterium]|nr:imidazole glycerol phosphate synthase subunit HisH [Endomicrobiia bacterium]